MKTTRNKMIFLIAILLFIFNSAYSQWESGQINAHFSLPEITLVDIEPGVDNSINFTISTGTEGGDSPIVEENTNETLWINYSSALPDGLNSRSVNAEISQGNLPEGISIFLEASSYSGTGKGNFGTPDGRVELSGNPQPIISGIGNCYTGNGVNNGHRLTFSIEISDYSELYATGNAYYLVLYTISDN